MHSTLINRTFLRRFYFLLLSPLLPSSSLRLPNIWSSCGPVFCLASLFRCWPFLSQKQCTGRTLLFHAGCFDPESNWNCSEGHTLRPQKSQLVLPTKSSHLTMPFGPGGGYRSVIVHLGGRVLVQKFTLTPVYIVSFRTALASWNPVSNKQMKTKF